MRSERKATGDPAALLRDRISTRILPLLARGLVQARGLVRPSAGDLRDTYTTAVSVLFRLLFRAYAEANDPSLCAHIDRGDLFADIRLPDTLLGPVLQDLLLTDFRGLHVCAFGSIYEGLLQSELAVAETDLCVDRMVVAKGEVYLHHHSGARKLSGTFFTKPFAVDHLLDEALEPALTEHLARLDALEEGTAAGRFFDFCVADLAMGSGHFLLAAADRIDRAFSHYLNRRPLQSVHQQLRDTSLRSLIARRCIYGIELNPIAVSLARLSLWVHTSAPGQPPSALDRNLAAGNALTDADVFPEVCRRDRAGFDVILGNPPWKEAKLEEDSFWSRHSPGFKALPLDRRCEARERLRRDRPDLARLLDEEKALQQQTRLALLKGPYAGMGVGDADLYKAFLWRCWQLLSPSGGRIGIVLPRSAFSVKGPADFRRLLFRHAHVHLVVLSNAKGWVFDDAEHRYSIALCSCHRSPPVGKSIRLHGPFASRESFTLGLRRPPSAFSADEVLAWTDTASLPLLPSEASAEVFAQLRRSPRLDCDDGRSWRVRALSEELHSKKEQHLLRPQKKQAGDWPVYKGKSFDLWNPDTGSYYGWADPVATAAHLLSKRRNGARLPTSPFAAFAQRPGYLEDPATLPCMAPRILIRRVSNRTNQRTVVAALVPAFVLVADQASCLLWPRGDEQDVAFLLGVLSSLPLDWYARRFVETDVRIHILNPLPVPRPSRRSSAWRRTVALAGRLAACDHRFSAWADSVGVSCGPLPDDQKRDHTHELDALVAHLYGLTQKQLKTVFETFREGWDYSDRLDATLRHYLRQKGLGR